MISLRTPTLFRRLTLAALLAGAWANAAQALTLTLYSAQHEQTVNLLIKDFAKQSGINVQVRSGEGPELAAQLLTEGSASPADVYFTENSPELMRLQQQGLLAPVRPSTLAQIPARYNSPQGAWVGVLARENVLVYNTTMIAPQAIAHSLLALAQPAWKGKIAIAPSDGDFLPLVSAVLASRGKAATLTWLRGLHSNAQIFDDDEGVTAAVNRGAVALGIINNYYWARLSTELGPIATHSALFHYANDDVGALVNVSGAAQLKSAHHPEAAQQFLAYLTSARAQNLLARNHVTFEYPLRPGVAADPGLKAFNQLPPPPDLNRLGDDRDAAQLLRQAGLL